MSRLKCTTTIFLPLITVFVSHLFTVNAEVGTLTKIIFPIFNKGWADKYFQERSKYFEGDILIGNWPVGYTEDELLKAGSHSPRWKDGVIPYSFHHNIRIPGRQAVLAAMQDIQSKTCLRFQPRKREGDYVYITMFQQGCYSYIGRDGGAQQLNLGPGCWHKTTIIHELVHTIGFWHEQSRRDRDKYINVQWNNIPPTYYREFQKHQRLNDFNTEYDYKSVMHYSFNAFAKNRRYPTITTKKSFPLRLLGTGDEFGGLTETDALQINRMYNCSTVDNDDYIISDQLNKVN